MSASRAILCLALGETIVWAGFYYLFPALLLRWEADAGWPKTWLTAAFAAAVIVSALVSPLAGRTIDRGHGPAIMAGSALAGAVLLALLPFAGSLPVFALLWLGIGAAMGGCLYEPCFALVTRVLGTAARPAITRITLLAGFAGTLSFPLNHWMAELAGWQGAVWLFAALVGFCGVPLILLGARGLERGMEYLPEDTASPRRAEAPEGAAATELTDPVAGPTAPPRPVAELVRRPLFWYLAAGFSLLGFNHGVVLNHLLPMLADRGVGLDIAVLAAAMIGPMQVAGRLALMLGGGRLSNGLVATLSFAFVMTATLCLIAAEFAPLLVIAFVVLQGSGYGVLSIMRPVMTREILGQAHFGAISGAMAVPYLVAYALSPFIGSLLWAAGGYDFALVAVAALTLVGLVCYRVALRLSAARAASPEPA
ncbi:MFS transporter [Aurantimonas sp. A2-1-M11]|uniref:MFS transporter n=1 Tax=Aurantimonas sp. A2-1-M11 TaxID=3113712 RepID=UPI002F95525E